MPRKRRAGINEQVYRPADGEERDPEISAFKVLPAYDRDNASFRPAHGPPQTDSQGPASIRPASDCEDTEHGREFRPFPSHCRPFLHPAEAERVMHRMKVRERRAPYRIYRTTIKPDRPGPMKPGGRLKAACPLCHPLDGRGGVARRIGTLLSRSAPSPTAQSLEGIQMENPDC